MDRIGILFVTGIANLRAAQSGRRRAGQRVYDPVRRQTLRVPGHDGASLSASLQIRAEHRPANRSDKPQRNSMAGSIAE